MSNVPRPVLTSASITGLIQSFAGILSFLGYANDATTLSGEAQGLVSAGILVVSLGGNLLHGLHAQAKVVPIVVPATPVVTPQS